MEGNNACLACLPLKGEGVENLLSETSKPQVWQLCALARCVSLSVLNELSSGAVRRGQAVSADRQQWDE